MAYCAMRYKDIMFEVELDKLLTMQSHLFSSRIPPSVKNVNKTNVNKTYDFGAMRRNAMICAVLAIVFFAACAWCIVRLFS